MSESRRERVMREAQHLDEVADLCRRMVVAWQEADRNTKQAALLRKQLDEGQERLS